jgi:uncharacterized protein YabE (DUF348 family)
MMYSPTEKGSSNMKRMKVVVAMIMAILLVMQCVALAETGWVEKKNGRVLFSSTGKQVTGFYQEGNEWYYLRKNGMLCDSWIRLQVGLYHADAEGHIDEGWQKFKGIWYTLRKVNIGTEEEPEMIFRWFYVDGSDEMPFGKREIADKWYDVTNTKAPLVGWAQYDGEKIYFNEDGTADVGWKEVEGNLMCFDLTGRMAKNQKVYIDGEYYTFNSKGLLKDASQAEAVIAKTNKGKEANPTTKPTDDPNPTTKPTDDPNPTTKPTTKPTAKPTETPGPVVTKETVTITEEIPFETEYQNDDTRFPEEGNKTIQAGVNGKKSVTYTVTYTDGVETAREKTGEQVTNQPVKEIISVPCKGHKVEVKEETKEESVPFSTETREDSTRIKGDPDQVLQEGQNGIKTYVYTVTYTDGVETGRTLKSESITTQPVNKIVSVATGTAPEYTISYVTETVEIPYGTIEEQEPLEYKGKRYVGNVGVVGQKEVKYEVKTDASGNQVSKTVVSETVTKSPVDELVIVGTFVPTYSTSVVSISLPGMHGERSSSLDSECVSWAQSMANNQKVEHSGPIGAESVGAWGSASAAASGVAAHGGTGLAWSVNWGAGCVALTETLPEGGTHTIYFACAKGGGGFLDDIPTE